MHRFVSLVTFQDCMFGLTEDGTVYQILYDRWGGGMSLQRMLRITD